MSRVSSEIARGVGRSTIQPTYFCFLKRAFAVASRSRRIISTDTQIGNLQKTILRNFTSFDVMASSPTSSTNAVIAENGPVKRGQAKWTPHKADARQPRLYLSNSFTRNKELFEPMNGNQVKFYICGPTVYDSAHMGHARAYLSFDIVRRVLSNYFNYDVLFVMNITDIDDKIIKRARQNFLYDQYVGTSNGDFGRVASDVTAALNFFKKKVDIETDPDKKKMLGEMADKVSSAILQVESELKNLSEQSDSTAFIRQKAEDILLNSRDILSEWLDNEKGSSINELSIFSKLARRFENDFLQDMATLNVLPPSVLTRVSEYIPEIVKYIEGIIANGYAYTTKDGSVYFDTNAFESSPKHFYAKLVHEAFGDKETADKHLKESEGELSVGADKLQEKKSSSDFALWKSSKEGEPFWDSPWGMGRPGWHIECSAMSSAILGDKLDIHAGGFDLKFPHHDNEIAQCEAYLDNSHWVNYFLHCGTLRIAGSKMSKSLKNFISIKQALKQYTSRQLRILFLMHTWTEVLDYSTNTMERVLQFEKFCNEFFLAVKNYIRKHMTSCQDESDAYKKFEVRELSLLENFNSIKCDIHDALCDSIDTRTTIELIRKIISLTNEYINEKERANVLPDCNLLKMIAEYITDTLKMFGAIPESQQFGFPTDQNGNSTENREELIIPYLQALADFREKVRKMAKEQKNLDILAECDSIRDNILPELGVRLEDRANETCVKLADRETLLREKELKTKQALEKEAEKLRKKNEQEAAKLKKQQQKEQQRLNQKQSKKQDAT
ncbi:tRNA synthetases class I (C) catalytic domain-containing protein [Ditylenchus destructor]|uniref:Cysteine--tRNA ligase, cytoplasmic n=1 Tax=Ditylenchus destructor TaxID=166010 RepID=A0AAD4N547_9BILA|nr:tRNA synthetases class I (C) catalytic domain-containing protein [Ditylenchus destructor]